MTSTARVTGSRLAADKKTGIHWQHRSGAEPAFDQQIFNDTWLAEQGYVVNSPTAGRGASLFLNINDTALVLRHYRRGGMVRNISEKRYAWLGLTRTRAWREFDVLCELEALNLPAPRPYACEVEHRGMSYSASLITYYLEGSTLAEQLCTTALSEDLWHRVGSCIRKFHRHGVCHADLNAHNILLDNGTVSLIDFDRARIIKGRGERQLENNLQRLHRSIAKIVNSGPTYYNEHGWAALKQGYVQA